MQVDCSKDGQSNCGYGDHTLNRTSISSGAVSGTRVSQRVERFLNLLISVVILLTTPGITLYYMLHLQGIISISNTLRSWYLSLASTNRCVGRNHQSAWKAGTTSRLTSPKPTPTSYLRDSLSLVASLNNNMESDIVRLVL